MPELFDRLRWPAGLSSVETLWVWLRVRIEREKVEMSLSASEKFALRNFVSILRRSGKPQSTFDTAVLKMMRELGVHCEETIVVTGFYYRKDTLREATYTLTNKRVKVVSYEGRLVTFIDTDGNVKRDSPSRFVWLSK